MDLSRATPVLSSNRKALPAMNDRPASTEALDAPGVALENLKLRVQRLEDAVATLQDPRQMEERVVERVSEKVLRLANADSRPAHEIVLDMGRRALPAAVEVVKQTNSREFELGPVGRQVARESWVLFDAYADARAILRMYVDPRYRMGWTGRVVPVVLLAAILLSWLWLPGVWALSMVSGWLATLAVKLADLVLAYILFKVLIREARRYRETSPDLPPTLRL